MLLADGDVVQYKEVLKLSAEDYLHKLAHKVKQQKENKEQNG